MTGIDVALGELQIVAMRDQLHDMPVAVRRFEYLGGGEFGPQFLRAEISPDHAAAFDGRKGSRFHIGFDAIPVRGVRQIDAIAVHVELPAVIDAADAALLIAAPEQVGAPVRAVGIQNAHAAVAVAERNQIFAKYAKPDRRAVRLRHLGDQHHRQPEPPEQVAHRGSWADANQQFVVFNGHHCRFLANWWQSSGDNGETRGRPPTGKGSDG